MASKKKSVSRKKNTPTYKKRADARRFRRFVSAIGISAVVSFGIASCVLNPQLQDTALLDPVVKHLSLERINIGSMDLSRLGFDQFDLESLGLERFVERFTWLQRDSHPAAAAVDGYVQTSFTRCQQFFPGQPPIVPAATALRELCFGPFAILHSGQTKTPVFVAQRLNRQMLNRAQQVQRKDRFYEEARLPASERAQLGDYRGSDYSRGHMAPAGDMHNDEAMAQSFSLANMVPQNQRHNAGVWSRVESDTRKYVMRATGDVYVFSGPVYAAGPETIGSGRVAVPTYLYKVVYDATTGKSWVHWHVHNAATKMSPPITYSEFVRRTGLHLLPSVN